MEFLHSFGPGKCSPTIKLHTMINYMRMTPNSQMNYGTLNKQTLNILIKYQYIIPAPRDVLYI